MLLHCKPPFTSIYKHLLVTNLHSTPCRYWKWRIFIWCTRNSPYPPRWITWIMGTAYTWWLIASFTKQTTFIFSCSVFCIPDTSLKWVNSKGKEFAPTGRRFFPFSRVYGVNSKGKEFAPNGSKLGSKFFPFRVDPFSENREKANLTELLPLKAYPLTKKKGTAILTILAIILLLTMPCLKVTMRLLKATSSLIATSFSDL